ncbi:hypothetical protein M231_02610 [Tremella mesenterica]|uniref:HTH CENPB-type domain-containing protein n=2 Tax=Tremella mesenterica TaxID=5217 RepID=A0A4Q1BQQ4_TREME|nr:hypothetical protein M231_02610 [Tremella mesenterica]
MSTHTSPVMFTRPEQLSPTAPSTSNTTPTRPKQHESATIVHPIPVPAAVATDFTSPSAYINHDAYSHTAPSTPHVSGLHDMAYDLSAHSLDSFDFAYTDYSVDPALFSNDNNTSTSTAANNHPEQADHTTPPALPRSEEERTPVVSDSQNPISASSLPAPPGSAHEFKPLMSPFRQFGETAPMMYHPTTHDQPLYQHQNQQHPVYIDPATAYYDHMSHFINMSPQDTAPAPFLPPPPQFAMPSMPVPMYPGPYLPGQPYDYGPPRSRGASPSPSITSAVSLARSASASSELRPPRPKVKLTYEDKRNIVELHRSNSSLRQEDIAKRYGVDRSTISKIILAAHRWTQPQEPQQTSAPKTNKSVGGRFPAIEAKMHQWMDAQIAQGLDVRDNIARDKAKAFAREIGFPMERFKASAKWLDKFKDRRKAAGKPTSSPMHINYAYYPYNATAFPMMSPMGGPVMLSRSQSTVTLSSSDSSGHEAFQMSPNFPSTDMATPHAPDRVAAVRSETDLLHFDTSTGGRQRSQSSPQFIQPAGVSPSSGKATRFPRPSPLNLSRQNSYHGTSPSPRRVVPLARTNSSQQGMRRPRPTSLAASAFGITPISNDGNCSPMQSPSTSGSSNGVHSRQRSDISLGFTSSMSGMTISPNMSDTSEPSVMTSSGLTVPPLTPITPGHGPSSTGVFPTQTDFDMHIDNTGGRMQYATMPNKHYAPHGHAGHAQYLAYPPTDFGPGYVQEHSWN